MFPPILQKFSLILEKIINELSPLAQRTKNRKAWPLYLWVILVVGAFIYFNQHPHLKMFSSQPALAYELVADKISQSARITVNVPEGEDVEAFRSGITFGPTIDGHWLASQDNQIYFQPSEKLKLGSHYSVSASTSQGIIKKDFLVDEDPKVSSIFPRADSESSENTEITIAFNRPIVPLATVDEMKTVEGVSLSPKTDGSWKWLSPRALQFSPKNGLVLSANYEVKVIGLHSLDGLVVPDFSQKFTTRNLRLEDFKQTSIVYDQPFILRFNQPVDLDRTKKEISLIASSTGEKQEFIAVYGTKKVWDEEKKNNLERTDKSAILVYLDHDKFGRKRYWDANMEYRLELGSAFPPQGDIALDERNIFSFRSSDLIASITAQSSRSSKVSQDIFDPQGKLAVSFYEDIDLDKSLITSDKSIRKEYGEKCIDSNIEVGTDIECEKTADKSKILISLTEGDWKPGDTIQLSFAEIINAAGQKINVLPISKAVNIYSRLVAAKTSPADGDHDAALTDVIVCTNNPITAPASEDYKKLISANTDFEIMNWSDSFRVSENDDKKIVKCDIGEFFTRIDLGLQPETDYSLVIGLMDDFGQGATSTIDFRTGKMPEKYLNFYHYQNYYTVTDPSKTKLAFAGENMEFVDMNICRLSAEDMLYYLNNKPDYWRGTEAVSGCLESINKRIDLPRKYWIKDYFRIDLRDYVKNLTGQYIITFTNPDYFDRSTPKRRVYERTYLTVTNLSVVEKREDFFDYSGSDNNLTDKQRSQLENLYWVNDLLSLSPVAGAEIKLYGGDRKRTAAPVSRGETDAMGVVKVKSVNKEYGVIVRKGDDSAIISDVIYRLEYGSAAYNNQAIYVYTDRPIYRPGQTVYFKGIYRIGFDGDYEIFRDKKIPVKIYDGANKEIYNKELDVSEYGTFDGELILPDSASLGSYRIEVKSAGWGFFDVEEYKGAAFKLDANADKAEYIAGDSLSLDVNAEYFFGMPVDGGEVEYSLTSQDYYFDKYQDEYFSFGRSWYNCVYDCYYGDKFLLRDVVKLDSGGKAKITKKLDFNKFFKDDERDSKLITAYITVKNTEGQTVSTQKSFIVHAGEFYLGVKTENDFLGKGQIANLSVKSVDTNGEAMLVGDVDLKINRVRWAYAKRQEVDGGYYYQWERRLDQVHDEKIGTDASGDWHGQFLPEEEGEYQIDISSKDSLGNVIRANQSFYVYGQGQSSVKPNNDTNLDLVAEKNDVKAGDMASVIIKSPYKQAKALISVERGKIYEYEIVDIDGGLYKYDFKVKEAYIPSVYVSVTLLSDKPEVKYGSQYFTVDSKEKTLSITAKTDKTTYLPGEDVKADFSVVDSNGKPVKAEFSVSVADLSVLALKGNPKKEPVLFFYGGFPLTISTISNLRNILFEADVPVGTKGGGGSEPEDLARKKRGVFKDTAYWQATVRTDDQGKASTRFTLPDNLTTWQMETVGLTTDTKLGTSYNEFSAKKRVMITPLAPRFVVPGDKFSVGAKVFNQTDRPQDLSVTFFSGSLESLSDVSRSVNVPSQGSVTVYFPVQSSASDEGEQIFILKAENKDYKDEIEQRIKPVRNNIFETTALSGDSTNGIGEYVYLAKDIDTSRGDVSVVISQSLATYLDSAFRKIWSYPYDDSSIIAIKLRSLALAKELSKLPGKEGVLRDSKVSLDGQMYSGEDFIKIAVDRLYANYHSEGLAYFPGGVPSIYLTMEALGSMIDLSAAGVNLEDKLARELFNELDKQIRYDQNLQADKNLQILVYDTLSAGKEYGAPNSDLTERIKAILKDKKFLQDGASNLSLARLVRLLRRDEAIFGKSAEGDMIKNLENRLNIDARGTFVSPNSNFMWQAYETSVADTGSAASGLAGLSEDRETVTSMLRWLTANRGQDETWDSPSDCLSALGAMIKFELSEWNEARDFSIQLALNGVDAARFDLSSQASNEIKTYSWPLSALVPEAANQVALQPSSANRFYYDIVYKYYPDMAVASERDEGFTVTRSFFARSDSEGKTVITSAKVGDIIRGHLRIVVPKQRNFVSIEDYIPAGTELVNLNLETENQAVSLIDEKQPETPLEWERRWREDNTKLWPDKEEMRDDKVYLFKQDMPAGVYEYDYYLRASVPGEYFHLPATVRQVYFPENFGRSKADKFEINQ